MRCYDACIVHAALCFGMVSLPFRRLASVGGEMALPVKLRNVQNFSENGREEGEVRERLHSLPAKTVCEVMDTPGCVAFDKAYTR